MIDLRRKSKIPKRCKLCKKTKKLSHRLLCKDCSIKLNQDAVSQLRVKRGPVYEKWKENAIAAINL